MTTPTEGVFAHGGSENCNHGPIRCACLDLATGEVLFDEEYAKKKRPEMEHGTCTDAATISILSAVIVCKRKEIKPVIWCKDPYAIERARNFMEWARTEQPPSDGYEERDWHPMILQAMAALTFDTSDVELHKWDKHKHGDNPLARGRYG
jgi:hypothetical protein